MKGRGKITSKKNAVVVVSVPQKKTQLILEAPIASMRNMLEIERYFNERILDQSTSIRNLSSCLASMNDERKYTNNKRSKQDVVMIVLAGPSSTGKTKTMRRMRQLLGMEENYEYEALFIEYYVKPVDYDPGDDKESSYGSAVRDRQDIGVRLRDALKIATDATTPPPYVMLFVHNFSHTTYPSGLINSLVYGSGGLSIPQGTKLLIMCTCQYGSEKIAQMSQRYDDTAEQYIRDEMRRGVVDTTMNRIDMFLPYYPLTRNVIKQLLGKRLDKFVQASGIVEHIGAQALKTEPAMKEMLINHILGKGENENVSGGLHNYVCALENKLGQLLQAGTTAYNSLHKKPPSDTIHLESTSFKTSYFGQILERQLDEETSDFIKSLKDDPRNQQVLANCDPDRAGTVDSVNMRYGVNPLCGLVMNVNYVTINNYYDTQETAKITVELKTRIKKLKGCLIAVNAAVEKEPHGAIGGIIKNNKELFNESSDDSGEETPTTPNLSLVCAATTTTKRKADNQLGEPSTQPQLKKPRLKEEEAAAVTTVTYIEAEDTGEDYYPLDELVFSDEQPYGGEIDLLNDILESDDEWEYVPPIPKKKGRPYTKIEGFTRVDQLNGRPAWQCRVCEQTLSKVLYTRNHKCR